MAKRKQAVVVAKSMSDINQLFNKQLKEPEATRPVISTPTRIVIDEDDTSSIVVWKILQDFRPRTLHEIEQRVINIVSQQDWYDDWMFNKMNIQAIALQMNTAGMLIRSGSSPYTYTLKQGVPMPLPPQAVPKPVKIVTTSLPNGKEALDNGNIVVSEGIDLAIWKTFSSLKPLSLDEAGELLFTFGFDRTKAKDRIVGLAKRGWFSRIGTSRLLKYQMKKNIRRPIAESIKEAPVRKDIDMVFKAKTTTSETDTEIKKSVTGGVVIPDFTGSKTSKSNPAPNNPLAVLKTDSIDQAIWKVMADYNTYTVNELTVLLSDYLVQNNFKPSSVSSRSSFLHLNAGWFTRTRLGMAYHYVLRQGIEMPTYDNPVKDIRSELEAKAANAKSETVQGNNLGLFPVDPESLLDRPSSSAPVRSLGESEFRGDFRQNAFTTEPEDELKLVKLSIEIKGVPYNIKQVKEIADGLVDFKTAEAPKNSLLEVRQQFFLSGNALTTDELTDLTNDLVNLGFIN